MKATTRLKFAAYFGLGRLAPLRWMVRQSRGRAAVVMYHQVLPALEPEGVQRPMTVNVVSPETFDAQIGFLSKAFAPCTLDDLKRKAGHDSTRPNQLPVVVTFDDGYRDNLVHALPLLERHGVPATIYVTTGVQEGIATSWWLELWDLLSEPLSVSILWQGETHAWPVESEQERTACYLALSTMLLALPLADQHALLELVRDGRPALSYEEEHLSRDEIRELDRHPLITIGAHTHRHPALSLETEDVVREEMLHSKRVLEDLLEHPVKHFAYPFGTSSTAAEREFSIAEQCGFVSAVTTRPSRFDGNSWFSIPRHSLREYHDIAKVGVKLSGWNAFWGLGV